MDIGPNFFLEVLCLGIYSSSSESKRILKSALSVYHDDIAENTIMDDDLSRLYMGIVREIYTSELDLTNDGEMATILLRFKNDPLVIKDPAIYTGIEKVVENRIHITPKRVDLLASKIKSWIRWVTGNKAIRKMFAKSQNVANTVDEQKQGILLDEVLEHCRELEKSYTDTCESSTLDFIDMTNVASIKNGLKQFTEKRKSAGMKSGLQAMNRMFGEQNSAAIGDFVGFGALSGHFKSGILISWARWCATLNKPLTREKGIPTIVFNSLENEAHENLIMWFREAYVNAMKASCDHLTDEEIVEYVAREYAKNGFTLLVYRKLGQSFGYDEWVAQHEELRAKGHHVVVSIIDYITLMKHEQGGFGNSADALQGLVGGIKNYCNHHVMLGITGFQLNGQAMEIANSGVNNIVKKYNESHLAGAKGIKRELDRLFFLHIEKNHLGQEYLTCCINKLKYGSGIKSESRYAAWPFGKFGILDDINGKDTSLTNIYDVEDVEKEESTGELVLF